jgi:hypothetical protein
MTISRVRHKQSDWVLAAGLMTRMGIPPKDPADDDDENEEEDEDDEDEEDEQPAVIREPDEC